MTPADGAPGPGDPARGSAPPPTRRPGLTTFTIEGRAAPALFVVGWLASLLGLGVAAISLGAAGSAGSILLTGGLALLAVGLVAAAGSQAIERRAQGVRAYQGPSPVLVFAAVLPTTLVLLVALWAPLVALGVDPEGPLAAVVALGLTVVVYVGFVRMLVVGTGALSWREMGVRAVTSATAEEIGLGALLALPVLVGTGILGVLLSQVLPPPPDVLPPARDTPGVAANLVAAAILAPVGEELFFRGFATTAWARTAGPRAALVRGSIFFALAHTLTVPGESAGQGLALAAFVFLVRLPVAFALGWVFLRRRSLYAAIALHAVFNGLQVLALASRGGAG